MPESGVARVENACSELYKCDLVCLQACGASEGAVQTGAFLPPDVRR